MKDFSIYEFVAACLIILVIFLFVAHLDYLQA